MIKVTIAKNKIVEIAGELMITSAKIKKYEHPSASKNDHVY